MEMARAFEDAAERTMPTATPAPAVGAVGSPRDARPRVTDGARPATGDRSDARRTAACAQTPCFGSSRRRLAVAKTRRPVRCRSGRSGLIRRRPSNWPDDTADPVEHAPSSLDWELPSNIDRIPVSRTRAAALGVVALALAGVIVANGWHREAPAAFSYVRESVSAWIQKPAPLPQPEATQSGL